MAESGNCSSCTCELLTSSDFVLCGCSFKFCGNCFNQHENDMRSFYSSSSEEQHRCPEHGKEFSIFCHDVNCMKVVCPDCVKDFHQGHMAYDLNIRIRNIVEEIPVHKERYNDEFVEIKNLISQINNQKVCFQREINDLQTMIQRKCDDLVKFVKITFDDQIKNLNQKRDEELEKISKELRSLKQFQNDIRNVSQLNAHFPINAPALKINSYYKKYREFMAEIPLEKIPTSFDAKKLAVVSNIRDSFEVHGHIRDFAGEVTGLVGDRICFSNSHEAVQTSNVYESENDEIKDICYDDYIGCLFVLLRRGRHYFIKMLKQTSEEYEIDLRINARCISILLLARHSILLFYESNLKLVPTDLRRFYVRLPEEIQKLNTVLAICSSPCQKFVYVLCSSGSIFRYNPSSYKYESRTIQLAGDVGMMNIDESLEYIVLSGLVPGEIIAYSYRTGIKTYQLGSPRHFYTCTLFLPGNILVTFRKHDWCLDIFNFPQENQSRNIPIGHLKKLSPICAMAKMCLDKIYICEKHRIYTVSL